MVIDPNLIPPISIKEIYMKLYRIVEYTSHGTVSTKNRDAVSKLICLQQAIGQMVTASKVKRVDIIKG